MKWLILALCFAPTLYESWTDRRGESKKDKLWDGLILVGYSVLLAVGAHLSGYEWVPVIVLLLAIRFALFDYICNWFLKRYSEGHKNINIWKFTGTTAYFDKLTAKVHWVLRLVIRGLVLVAAVWWYCTIEP